MSVEIRLRTEGDCECGLPKPIGYERKCRHWWECDWGAIDNSEADPKRGLQHLMLVTGDYIRQLLDTGQQPGPRGGTISATIDELRIFAHMDYGGRRTTWELFKAHFEDGGGPDDLYIGRWPD